MKLICLVIFASLNGLTADGALYSIQDLGSLSGTQSQALGINNSSQVVGWYSYGPNIKHAFLWTNGSMQDIGTLGGANSDTIARGINDSSQIVGQSALPDGNSRAFVYFNGHMTNLGALSGSNSSANAINGAGEIVGQSQVTNQIGFISQRTHAFLVTNGVMMDIGTLGGPTTNSSEADAINSGGLIVGQSTIVGDTPPNAIEDGYLYQNGNMSGLGTYTLGTRTYRIAAANGINDSGEIVGSAVVVPESLGSAPRAYLINGTNVTDLGGTNGYASEALAINNNGQVVGYTYPENGTNYRAFVYDKGTVSDLNNLVPSNSGWSLERALAINDQGQIVGSGVNSSGQSRAFLLTPMPVLGISAVSSGVVVSWPTNAVGFSLYQSPDLINWSMVTNQPDAVGCQNQVAVLNPAPGQVFFRLQK